MTGFHSTCLHACSDQELTTSWISRKALWRQIYLRSSLCDRQRCVLGKLFNLSSPQISPLKRGMMLLEQGCCDDSMSLKMCANFSGSSSTWQLSLHRWKGRTGRSTGFCQMTAALGYQAEVSNTVTLVESKRHRLFGWSIHGRQGNACQLSASK